MSYKELEIVQFNNGKWAVYLTGSDNYLDKNLETKWCSEGGVKQYCLVSSERKARKMAMKYLRSPKLLEVIKRYPYKEPA